VLIQEEETMRIYLLGGNATQGLEEPIGKWLACWLAGLARREVGFNNNNDIIIIIVPNFSSHKAGQPTIIGICSASCFYTDHTFSNFLGCTRSKQAIAEHVKLTGLVVYSDNERSLLWMLAPTIPRGGKDTVLTGVAETLRARAIQEDEIMKRLTLACS
jgi:hypothetical protein